MQIPAYVSDGKGGVRLILIDEPEDIRLDREFRDWLRTAKNYVDDGIQDAKDVAKTYADSTFATQANAQDKENLIATLSAKIAELDAKIALVDTLAKAVDAKVELLKVAAPK